MNKIPDIKIGDVFYRIEATDHKYYTRKCRVCEGKKELVVNGIMFKCPMCQKEQETLRIWGYKVRRYRVYSIEQYIDSSNWKYEGTPPTVRFGLYHKDGKGMYCGNHNTVTVHESTFSDRVGRYNCPDPFVHSLDNYWYSDYKLAVEIANKLTLKQVDVVRAYNEENNTDYELPVFNIEHDKKSN